MGVTRKNYNTGLQLGLFPPESTWSPPERFPDLSDAKIIAFDTETKDPYLRSKGPGGIRGDGYMAGFSVATDTGFSGYFPIAHLGGGNMDKDIALHWLQDTMKNPNQIKVGANTIYDLEWLHASGVSVAGPIRDVQIMEALIDEEGLLSLEHLSRKYLNDTKQEDLLRNAAANFGINPKSEMWKLHAKYVGAYGEGDAVNTLGVYQKQLPIIDKENLNQVFKLESDITPIMFKMRLQGVKIDMEKAHALNDKLLKDYEQMLFNLKKEFGFEVNPWSAQHLSSICKKLEIVPPRTKATAKYPNGQESFVKDWFLEQGKECQPIKDIVKARTMDRLRGTFIQEKIINAAINGRIHAQFHQVRGDEDGTRTGRLSSSNPNLQQVPSRDELAPLIRGLFIPEVGDKWCKLDYSQQEPRIAVHFANVCKFAGAVEATNAYINGMDFYDFVMHAAGITRRQAKDLTLGRMYGMGIKKMAEKLHREIVEAETILLDFDRGAPFLKKLAEKAEASANKRGYIKTIGGRRRHFNLFVPVGRNKFIGRPRKVAEAKWQGERLVRYGCRKALNSLIQGSAADMTKQAMLDIYNATGYVPLMQVHDELNYSLAHRDTAKELKVMSEQAMKLTVPVVCDLDWEDSWK